MAIPPRDTYEQVADDAIRSVMAIYDLAPALLLLARRLSAADADLIHRVLEALPASEPMR